jgi:hypothetical protein
VLHFLESRSSLEDYKPNSCTDSGSWTKVQVTISFAFFATDHYPSQKML